MRKGLTAVLAAVLLPGMAAAQSGDRAALMALLSGESWNAWVVDAPGGTAPHGSLLVTPGRGHGPLVAGRVSCGAVFEADLMFSFPEFALSDARIVTDGCDDAPGQAAAQLLVGALNDIRSLRAEAAALELLDGDGVPLIVLRR